MVGETLLFVVGLGGTLLLGAPIANALAQPHRWRALFGERAERVERERLEASRPFKPLDLGPDPVRWPSERPWGMSTTLPTPDWPSRSWKDEHFGSHWRSRAVADVKDRGFHAMAARRADEADTPDRPPPSAAPKRAASAPARDAGDAWFQQEPVERRAQVAPIRPAGERAADQRRRQQAATPIEDARRRQQQIALEQARRAQPQRTQAVRHEPARPPTPAPAAPRHGPRQPPERAELEELIARVGLAGTVQFIMERTGWEFREAAHYLAKVRTEGR